MKTRIIILGLILLCFGISQIEDVPKAKQASQEESVLEEKPFYDNGVTRGAQEAKGIQPQPLKFKSGRTGWKVQIPGNRPLATVAYENGLIFVGGGYGSYEFYALEAKTGKLVWMFKTGDDGPTAAAVKKGYVVFNTESCIIYVLKAKTGEKVWEKWLGDPLMSQPAIDDKYVYMAYPGNDGSHHLACMTLEKGEEVWNAEIAGDLISAPIIDDGSVYITCFDGTVYRYKTKNGKLVWSQKKQATCAPTVHDNQIFISLRQEQKDGDVVKQYEGMATLDDKDGGQRQKELWSKREAPYLSYGRSSAKTSAQAELDASVGFGSAPAAAKLDQAKNNIGQYSVAGCWAYQGSRPVIKNGYSYNAMGNEIQALDIASGKQRWSKKYDDLSEEGIGGRVFSPPSYANEKLFLGSGSGEVFCLKEKNGKVLWKEKIDGSISFQPTIAKGVVFVSCDNGLLYGINTGDGNDDGWYMWGGNSEHNK